MRNQFVYTEIIEVPAVEESIELGTIAADAYELVKKNSFNVNLVIRTISLDDEGLLVLLNDIHERLEDIRKINPKNGKISIIKEKGSYQSEIRLSKGDAKRFLLLTDISKTDNE